MEPTTTASPWLTATNSSFYDVNVPTNSGFWGNSGFRKRKAAATDLDEKTNQKLFVTEEKVLKEMQTLSLALDQNQSARNASPNLVEEDFSIDDVKSDSIFIEDESSSEKSSSPNNFDQSESSNFEFHPIIKEQLGKDRLQDALLRKLCENERKKLSMQLVPYVPIHPNQLKSENSTKDEEEDLLTSTKIEEFQVDNDDNLFKRPNIPTVYTVEEPCEVETKRASTMKRSFSQCTPYNGNLNVTELSNDSKDDLSIRQSSSSYFIVEPKTSSNSISESNFSMSTNESSIRISEIENNEVAFQLGSNRSNDLDEDFDMQSVASSDTADKMEDD